MVWATIKKQGGLFDLFRPFKEPPLCLQIPNQKHKTQLTEMIIQELTEESKLKSLYKGYIKENDINITETDFIMHHFRKLSNREINRYIKNYIN